MTADEATMKERGTSLINFFIIAYPLCLVSRVVSSCFVLFCFALCCVVVVAVVHLQAAPVSSFASSKHYITTTSIVV